MMHDATTTKSLPEWGHYCQRPSRKPMQMKTPDLQDSGSKVIEKTLNAQASLSYLEKEGNHMRNEKHS